MIIPYGDDNPRVRTPYVNYSLLAANAIVFAALAATSPAARERIWTAWGFVPAEPSAVSILTSLFLHADLFHLAGNMLFLWIVGDNVEDKLGHLGYAGLYLAGGLAANVVHLMTAGDPGIPTIGASGAISAVLAAYLVFFPRNEIKFFVWFLFFVKTFRVPSVVAIVFWLVLQLLEWAATSAGMVSNVAYGAHVGGFVFGAAAAMALGATGVLKPEVFRVPLDTMRPAERLAPAARRKLAEREVRPDQVESRIRSALEGGEPAKAADLYLSLRFTRGGHVLEPGLQNQVADAMAWLGWHRYAAEAYRLYLDRHEGGPHRGHALASLARIHALELADYDEALVHLRRAERTRLDDADARTLEEVRTRLADSLARIEPAGADPDAEGYATILRRTDEKVNPSRFGRIVQETTGEPLADATRRFAGVRGLVASRLPLGRARELARRLQANGLPVLVVEEDRLVGLPEVRPAAHLDLRPDGLRFRLTSGDVVETAWDGVFLVVGAWSEEIRELASGDPETAQAFRFAAATMPHIHGRVLPHGAVIAREPKKVREQWPLLDFFVLEPWSRIRVRSAELTFRGQTVPLKRIAQLLLRHGARIAMNEGVYIHADRGNKSRFSFERLADLDEYERWLLQLAEFDRTR